MSFEGEHITDTSFLLYFLLADSFDLLGNSLGSPVQVPIDVYDPEDIQTQEESAPPEDLLSEMRGAIEYYEHEAEQGGSTEDLRRLLQIDTLYKNGIIRPIEMSQAERFVASQLRSVREAGQYGIKAVLGAGEAACVAIANNRGWVIATDDTDALKVMDFLHGGRTYRYERIRKLLIRAADDGFITMSKANILHEIMTTKGFWDRELPFPETV